MDDKRTLTYAEGILMAQDLEGKKGDETVRFDFHCFRDAYARSLQDENSQLATLIGWLQDPGVRMCFDSDVSIASILGALTKPSDYRQLVEFPGSAFYKNPTPILDFINLLTQWRDCGLLSDYILIAEAVDLLRDFSAGNGVLIAQYSQ